MKMQPIYTPLDSTVRPCLSMGAVGGGWVCEKSILTISPVDTDLTGDVRLRAGHVPAFATVKGIGSRAWGPPV